MASRLVAFVLVAAALRAQSLSDTLVEAHRLLRRDEVTAAAELTAKAVAQAAGVAAVQELLGELHFRQGEVDVAKQDFKSAIGQDPKMARAWWGLGRVLDSSSLHHTAELYIRQAYFLDPDDPDVLYSYAHLLKSREHIAALRRYLKLAQNWAEGERLEDVRQDLELEERMGDRKLRRLASAYETSEIPLSAEPGSERIRGFSLMASVNGGKPIRLLLDTGASGIILRSKAAEKAGIEKLGEIAMRGVGDEGDRAAFGAVADRIQLGNVVFQDYPIRVTGAKAFYDEDGLIGTDVFASFLVTLDFHNRKLRLQPFRDGRPDPDRTYDRATTQELSGFTPVQRLAHFLMVDTTVNDARPVYFVLDTGASVPIVSKTAAAGTVPMRADNSVRLRGASGAVKDVLRAGQVDLQFAGFHQKSENTLALDLKNLSKHTGMEVSGLLSFTTLETFRLTLDYRDGLVRFDSGSR